MDIYDIMKESPILANMPIIMVVTILIELNELGLLKEGAVNV